MSYSKYCEPCEENETQSISIVWCSECEQTLCSSCQKVHRTLKATKSHHLVQMSDLSSGSAICLTSYKVCPAHSDFLIEFYCSAHDQLCCKSCITGTHRLCEIVVPIETAAKNVKRSTIFENLTSDISRMMGAIADLKAAKLKNERAIEDQARKAKDIGAANKQALIEQLNRMEKQLQSKIASLKQKALSELNLQDEHIKRISDQVTQLQEEIDVFRQHGSDVQTYTMTHFIQKPLQKAVTEFMSLILATPLRTIKFISPAESSLKGSVGLGDISMTSSMPNISLKLSGQQQAQAAKEDIQPVPPENNTLNFSKKGTFSLGSPKVSKVVSSCIAWTRDNHILACDKSGISTLALKYNMAGQLLGHCDLEEWANEVKYIPDTDEAVVYIPGHRSIQFIDVRGMVAMGSTKINGSVGGLATLNCQIYVGGKNKIFVLNINGEIIERVGVDPVVAIRYLHVLENKNVLFAGENKILYCLPPNGKTEVLHEFERSIKGICSDQFQNVYVMESGNGTISVLPSHSQRKQYIQVIDGLERPMNVAFSCDFTKVGVVTKNGKNVEIYERC